MSAMQLTKKSQGTSQKVATKLAKIARETSKKLHKKVAKKLAKIIKNRTGKLQKCAKTLFYPHIND